MTISSEKQFLGYAGSNSVAKRKTSTQIHVDNYPFTMRKGDMPLKVSDRYWNNIQELKECHSLALSLAKSRPEPDSSHQLNPLFESLKIKKHGHINASSNN